MLKTTEKNMKSIKIENNNHGMFHPQRFIPFSFPHQN